MFPVSGNTIRKFVSLIIGLVATQFQSVSKFSISKFQSSSLFELFLSVLQIRSTFVVI